jgi:cyclohexyl-isocyanide hydratase
MQWLYHLAPADDAGPLVPGPAGFVHASHRDALVESARLHFAAGAELRVWQLDPRRLAGLVRREPTPRGPMPHIHGAIPDDAVAGVHAFASVGSLPDRVTGTRVAFVAFEGMTLLDMVGCYDAVSRIASMGFDTTASIEIIGATPGPWNEGGAELRPRRVRPRLADYDVVVVPGGYGTRALAKDEEIVAWIEGFPPNRRVASVCTGALLLGAAGRLRGRRATTHHLALPDLAAFGAEAVPERVVVDGPVVTAGGVSSAIDLGLWLVAWLEGREVAERVAMQMELWPDVAARVFASASWDA